MNPSQSPSAFQDFETQKLTAEQEKSLFAELAQNRDDPKVRDKVARAFLGFALAQARKDFKGRTLSASLKSGLSLDDAVSAANYGLMNALDRFDHTRGFRFTTYAGWWIKKSLHEAAIRPTRSLFRAGTVSVSSSTNVRPRRASAWKKLPS